MPPIPAEYLKILEYLFCGAVGGLIGGVVKQGRVQLPRLIVRRDSDGEVRKFIDLGFLLSVFAGAALAAIIDGRPQTATAYGIAAGFVGPVLIRTAVERLFKNFGYSPDVPLPRSPLADEVKL